MVGGREPIEPMRLYTEQQQRHDLNYEPDKVADAPQAAWGRSEAPTVELDSLEEWKGATLASRRVADGLRQNNLVSAAPRYPSTGVSASAGAQADRPPLWLYCIARRPGRDEPVASRPRRHSLPSLRTSATESQENITDLVPPAAGPRRHSLPSLRSSAIASSDDSGGALLPPVPVPVGELSIPFSTLLRHGPPVETSRPPACAHAAPLSRNGHETEAERALPTGLGEPPASSLPPPPANAASSGPCAPAMLPTSASFSGPLPSGLRTRRNRLPGLLRSPSQPLYAVPKSLLKPALAPVEARVARFVLVDA